jgi:hypothetical protein
MPSKYKQQHHLRFVRITDLLAIAKEMGYRRQSFPGN